ncbi:ACP S-malonyltransferase [Bacillus cereus]|uniref:ACP S-malonyltransferase n=1 Tax=Bacillus cereus group TaxID=86661 RepID=UPI002AC019D8|nr:ACP S-malonyltransferase [Bacillus cereus]MDA2563384.1 ACP S-malonyltransferase [Bacillus cereus]MDA2568588.1 ACP S-malonyltransferase [Bacillus cereus]MDZ4583088.1 ACP S-malonyltransferase [Bacillus cereus]
MEKIAMVFPGQGSQYVGMGKALCEEFSLAKMVFEEASDVLHMDLKKICFSGDSKVLTSTENAQPAILATSVAMFRVYLQEFGVFPDYVAGHSLGEFSALTCMRAIPFSDALKLVRTRGQLMKTASDMHTGMMLAVNNFDKNILKEVLEKVNGQGNLVSVACYNSPTQTVISGDAQAIQQVESYLKQKKVSTNLLNVSAPFHSSLMESVAESFTRHLDNNKYHSFKGKIISNTTALPYVSIEEMKRNLTLQITKPVKWRQTIDYLKNQGVTIAIEMGPKGVLTNLSKGNVQEMEFFAYDNGTDKKLLFDRLNVAPRPKYSLITRCLGMMVATKNYNTNTSEYASGVIESIRMLRKIQEDLELNDKKPSIEQMHYALKLLKTVFDTKRVPFQEQQKRFEKLYEETGVKYSF